MSIARKLRSKKDTRLYFRYHELGVDLGRLKTILIRLKYIEHIEGDRFIELKRLPKPEELKKIIQELD